MNLNDILEMRDNEIVGTYEWATLNSMKSILLEEIKPSTQEIILFFKENNLINIPIGFSKPFNIDEIPGYYHSRSWLEYNDGLTRHPIPYCLVRYQDKYFFIFRESGSGEMRLIGKKGLLGGHVNNDDMEDLSNENTIKNAMRRELFEEAGITKDMINNFELKGVIKSNDGVDQDHLGLVYEIELNTDNIKSEEEGILSGMWINKDEIHKHYDSLESWSKIVYDNIIK